MYMLSGDLTDKYDTSRMSTAMQPTVLEDTTTSCHSSVAAGVATTRRRPLAGRTAPAVRTVGRPHLRRVELVHRAVVPTIVAARSFRPHTGFRIGLVAVVVASVSAAAARALRLAPTQVVVMA